MDVIFELKRLPEECRVRSQLYIEHSTEQLPIWVTQCQFSTTMVLQKRFLAFLINSNTVPSYFQAPASHLPNISPRPSTSTNVHHDSHLATNRYGQARPNISGE